jgi:hypothetical protein
MTYLLRFHMHRRFRAAFTSHVKGVGSSSPASPPTETYDFCDDCAVLWLRGPATTEHLQLM